MTAVRFSVEMQKPTSHSVDHYVAARTKPPTHVAVRGRIPEAHSEQQRCGPVLLVWVEQALWQTRP